MHDLSATAALVVDLWLAFVFAIHGATKLRAVTHSVNAVLDYQLLPPLVARLFGKLLPFLELGTGVLLLWGVFPLVATTVAMALLLCFAIATALAMRNGRKIKCGCLGGTAESVVGWPLLVRQLILIAATASLLDASWHSAVSPADWLHRDAPLAIEASCFALFLTACYFLASWALSFVTGLDRFTNSVRTDGTTEAMT